MFLTKCTLQFVEKSLISNCVRSGRNGISDKSGRNKGGIDVGYEGGSVDHGGIYTTNRGNTINYGNGGGGGDTTSDDIGL